MTHRLWLATPLDAAKMAELHEPAFVDHWPEEAFASLLSREEVFAVLGATGNERVAKGFVLMRAVAGEAEVLTLCVAAESRRDGLGQSLLIEACKIARARGADHLFLEVAEGNEAATHLYQKLGFKPVGRRAAYYRQSENAADALVMRRDLNWARPEET
jgi:[ribosomal protein S18]-alanine N-acetyltransferase